MKVRYAGEAPLDLSALLIFSTTLFLVGAAPGPSIAALIARVLVRGWRDVVPFVLAFWLGEMVWLTVAIAGLSALIEAFYWGFIILKYCGIAYLLFLAWQMWFAPVTDDTTSVDVKTGKPVHNFLAGLAITFSNPKIMAFYLALLPTIIDLDGVTLGDWSKLIIALLVVVASIDVTYIVLAERARGFLKNPKSRRVANRIGATTMGTAAALIATRSN